MNIPILYEDEWFVIVDKPAGLLTVPTPRNEPRTLTSILNDDAAARGIAERLYPCHRLDRETSGVIIYAKGPRARDAMSELFLKRLVEKRYTAFAHGSVRPAAGSIRSLIKGSPAETSYRVVKDCSAFSILDISPRTGRTNQIRIHCKRIAHPLVGESRFAFRKDFALKAKRTLLHAAGVRFRHPMTGVRVAVTAAMPRDMAAFLEKNGGQL